MARKESQRSVLKKVEQPHVNDESGCSNQSELDEFFNPRAQSFPEALGGLCSDVLICGHGTDFNV